jgi:hypothetical protein
MVRFPAQLGHAMLERTTVLQLLSSWKIFSEVDVSALWRLIHSYTVIVYVETSFSDVLGVDNRLK